MHDTRAFIPVLKSGVLMFVWWAFKPLVFTFCPKLMKTEGVPRKCSVFGVKGSSGIIMQKMNCQCFAADHVCSFAIQDLQKNNRHSISVHVWSQFRA